MSFNKNLNKNLLSQEAKIFNFDIQVLTVGRTAL